MNLFKRFFAKQIETPQDETLEERKEIDFSNFEVITDFIYKKSGITDLDKRTLSLSCLKQFAQEKSLYSTEDFLEIMQKDREFYQDVLNIVTVNETFFFREVQELKWLVAFIKKSDKNFNILSLPCSSGEEVYSILILLDDAGVDLNRITITGYDINTLALEKAKTGLYSEHSLHKLDAEYRSNYFTHYDDEHFLILQKYREKVKFIQKNIFEIQEKNIYDIVISRNMFIYFDNKKREEATNIIVSLIKDGGHYIKGYADNISTHPYLKSECYGVYSIDKMKH